MGLRQIVACACVSLWPVTAALAQPALAQSAAGGIDRLVYAIERAVEAGDTDGLRSLARPDVRPAVLAEFVLTLTAPKASHSAVKERDRTLLETGRGRPVLEKLTQRHAEGRVTTRAPRVGPAGTE